MAGEVSARVCLALVEVMADRGFASQQLLDGLAIGPKQLRRPSGRVSWAEFCTLLRRAEVLLGGPEGLTRLGEDHARRPVFSWFPAVAQTAISPRDLYWLGARAYGRSALRNVTCRFEDVSSLEIREILEIDPASEDSPQFFAAMLGVLRSGPRLIGLPDARVEMVRGPRRADFLIRLPRSRTLKARFMRRFRFSSSAIREVVDELTLQHQELIGAYEKLSESHAALRAEIAERERTENRLRQAQKLEAVGRLAAGIAHDFNNLLTVIGGYAEDAAERHQGDALLAEDLESIKVAADRATELTGSLLAFSRVQTSKPQVLDLNDVVVRLEEMLRRLIGDHIELSVGLAPDLGGVRADRGQLEQLLLNLVINARDAMPRQGSLAIETANASVESAGRDAIPRLEAGDYVCLTVADTGCGMDEEALERMFEPFYTTKPTGAGTGLGLSIVYGILQQHAGHIEVSSKPGAGTTLRVYLPRCDRPARRDEESALPARDSTGSETVLVVEDDRAVRRLARRALEKAGYEVLEAADGRAGSEVARRHPGSIQMLVTDVQMPYRGGHELARELRRLDAGLRVLFVSGYPVEGLLQSLGAGSDFLRKPFSTDELRHKVRSLLDAPGADSLGAGAR